MAHCNLGSVRPFRLVRVRDRPTRDSAPSPSPLSIAAIGALAGLIGSTIPAAVAYWAASQTFDAKMVEIGVGILATDPGKSDVVPARQWAIDLVETHSGHRFSDEDRSKLLHSPIVACREVHPIGTDLSDPCRSISPLLP